MGTDYSTYHDKDFLADDYFVHSMLYPTSESEEFWKLQLDSKIINVDEFIAAYMTLKDLHEFKPTVDNDRIELIWDRILETNKFKAKQKYFFKIVKYVAVACIFLGITGVTYFKFFGVEGVEKESYSQSITDFAKENILHVERPAQQVQIISGSQVVDVDGTQVKVEYNENGKVKVNEESMVLGEKDSSMNSKIVYNQLNVPYGKRAFLTLSDGSTLWVNTGTTVIYPVKFAKEKREVFIEGEVYAEVVHDSKRPFIIKTKKLDVQVLGTILNISAYNEDKQTNVVLVSGSVNVKPLKGKATIIKPSQLYSYGDKATTLSTVDVDNYTSWHNGNYIFKSEPIENILLRLSRYYNVTMKLPSSPSGISCSGKLELKDDLNQLLNGLSEITTMSYAIKDNEYRIKFE